MPRPVSRPILISIEVPGSEPVQKRIAADGKYGRGDAGEAIDFFRRAAAGLDTGDPPKDGIVVRFLPAPLLNPDAPVPDTSSPCPAKYVDILDNIRFSSNYAVSRTWQLALLSTDWLDQHGVRGHDLELLDLFLADYGLCHGMTREDLPPGEDKPWNREPYFEEPKNQQSNRSFDNAIHLAVFAKREELLAQYPEQVVGALEWFLGRYHLRLDMEDEDLPRGDYPWCQPSFQKPTSNEIFAALGNEHGGVIHEIFVAWLRELPR